ncbi:MAG TPA: sialidase family protein [Sphingobacterium sp.]|nr:sialidase family protein [Sphingobacterium sp.]
MMRIFLLSSLILSCFGFKSEVEISEYQYQLPVLKNKENNPILRVKITADDDGLTLSNVRFSTKGTTDLGDIKSAKLYYYGQDSLPGKMEDIESRLYASVNDVGKKIVFSGNQKLNKGDNFFWLSFELEENADLANFVDATLVATEIDGKKFRGKTKSNDLKQRIGIAVRKHNQDKVHTSRIPGLATTNEGTLIAVFDARYESGRDLQGHIDIGIHRSEDGGQTWEPIQIVMDMGEWGDLPQKFNGVSDAGILVDRNTGDIYIAGLWMHGLLDKNGNWIEGLDEESEEWDHQWRNKASQPGFDVKQTSQFLIVKSTDDGKTWSKPVNVTKMGKKEEWWLWAPAPGQGITLEDGTLVFPTQGRDKNGHPFSNITYSKDGGKTWISTNPAVSEGTTECMAVELTDGSVMLNMRANSNRGDTTSTNGRAIAVTKDLGETWTEHPTSHNALPEPVSMASIIRHDYKKGNSIQPFMLFSNPDSKTHRNRLSVKVSDNDGENWDRYPTLMLDELNSRGYSCLTSIDNETIGILYESSQADMVFQTVTIKELTNKN